MTCFDEQTFFLGTKTLDPHPVAPDAPWQGPADEAGQDYADLFRELRGDLVNKETEKAPQSKNRIL